LGEATLLHGTDTSPVGFDPEAKPVKMTPTVRPSFAPGFYRRPLFDLPNQMRFRTGTGLNPRFRTIA